MCAFNRRRITCVVWTSVRHWPCAPRASSCATLLLFFFFVFFFPPVRLRTRRDENALLGRRDAVRERRCADTYSLLAVSSESDGVASLQIPVHTRRDNYACMYLKKKKSIISLLVHCTHIIYDK